MLLDNSLQARESSTISVVNNFLINIARTHAPIKRPLKVLQRDDPISNIRVKRLLQLPILNNCRSDVEDGDKSRHLLERHRPLSTLSIAITRVMPYCRARLFCRRCKAR